MKQTTSTVSREDVVRIASLAKLTLTDEEISLFSEQLGATVTAVQRLEEIDTRTIQFPPQLTGLSNILREDTILPSLSQQQVLANAGRTANGYFVVPALFSE